MRAQKDPKTKKWYVQYRYTDWKGDRRKSTKRGFETRKAAEEWVRSFLQMQQSDLDMNFEDFVRIYLEDVEHRTREHMASVIRKGCFRTQSTFWSTK